MWGFSTNSSTAATNTNTWGNWVVNDSTVTTGTSAATTVWQVWVDHSATGTTTSNAVYGYWVQSCQGHRFMPTHYPCPPETEEQRLQRLEDERAAAERRRVQQEEWDRKDREMRARYEAARLRAKELLLSCLDEIQRRELTEKSWFLVVSGSGKVYRIRHGVGGNIDLLGDDGKDHSLVLCPHGHGRAHAGRRSHAGAEALPGS